VAGAHLSEGTVLGGDFRVQKPLSSGGFGAVYVAEQVSTGAKRAVKVLHRDLVADERARQRFEQEARVSVRIKSDHVVQVVAAGVDEKLEIPWIAMELLEGETLADWIQNRGRATPSELAEIFAQLTHALGAAHDEGIVHRDLKPENVFLCETRRAGAPFTVKILDFGIAKLVAEAHARTTETIGTPLWMAPEQTTPGAAITPATDVWALGLLAFRMLTATHYWKGANTADLHAVAVLREVAFEPLVAASERANDNRGEKLPDGFDAWFARCVVRDPKERFEDARAACEALQPILAAAPATNPVRAISRTERARIASAPTAPQPEVALAKTAPSKTDPSAAAATSKRSPIALVAVALVAGAAGIYGFRAMNRARNDRANASPSISASTSASAEPSASIVASASASASASAGTVVAQPPPIVSVCPDGIRKIPGGTYKVGHTGKVVTIGPFCIAPTETTIEAYADCAASKLCPPGQATVKSPVMPAAAAERWSKLCNFGKADRAGHPMNCVDFASAEAYCKSVGMRLPLEEEWEWAGRGGEEARLYPWGNVEPPVKDKQVMCWLPDTGKLGTCQVASFPAGIGRWELGDMAGNVREWVLNSPDDEPEKKIFRGGCFGVTSPIEARVEAWDAMFPENRLHNVGFRCAATFAKK